VKVELVPLLLPVAKLKVFTKTEALDCCDRFAATRKEDGTELTLTTPLLAASSEQ
jgi:hypothetical protein